MRALHEISVKLREFAKTATPNSVEITTKFYADHNAFDRQQSTWSTTKSEPLRNWKNAISRRCYKSVVSPVLMSSWCLQPALVLVSPHRRVLNQLQKAFGSTSQSAMIRTFARSESAVRCTITVSVCLLLDLSAGPATIALQHLVLSLVHRFNNTPRALCCSSVMCADNHCS